MTDSNSKKWDDLRNLVIGLGEQSSRKSFYPELQKKLEELKASEQDLVTLFNHTYDAIFFHDNDGIIYDVNKSMLDMYGLSSKEEALAYSIEDYSDTNFVKEKLGSIWDLLKEKPNNVVFEWRARKPKTGESFDVEVALRPVVWKSRDANVAIVRDISYRKKEEKEKNELLEKLTEAKLAAEAASYAKSNFLANMSHEIRTPMNTILGMIEVLKEYPLQKEQRELIDTIQKSGVMLVEVINNILDLSKIEAGTFAISNEPFDLRETLKPLLKIYQLKAEDKGLYFNINYPSDLSLWFVGDGLRIKQIINNLLSNAMKFTSKGGITFTLNIKKYDNDPLKYWLDIFIEDTGIGISVEKRQQVFERFNQLDASITREYGGTGLGLSISQQLAHLMGGAIQIESKMSKGACFKFEVALESYKDINIPEFETEVQDKSNLLDTLNGKRILLADDADENRQLIHLYLRKSNIVIDNASNGEEACQKFFSHHYDLVLMDISMPVMDGYSAVRLIRQYEIEQNLSPTPIIACTAFALTNEREQSLAAGCDLHLAKPVAKMVLIETLAKFLVKKCDKKHLATLV